MRVCQVPRGQQGTRGGQQEKGGDRGISGRDPSICLGSRPPGSPPQVSAALRAEEESGRAVSRPRGTRRWHAWSTCAVAGRLRHRSQKAFTSWRWRWGGEGRRTKKNRRGQGSGAAAIPEADHSGKKDRLDETVGAPGDIQKCRRQGEVRRRKGRGTVRQRGTTATRKEDRRAAGSKECRRERRVQGTGKKADRRRKVNKVGR